MTEDSEIPISLDLEPLDDYLQRTPAHIERQRARTANTVAILLIIAVAFSLPIHVLSIFAMPGSADPLAGAFEKWYSLVSPLAGAAVGAYYATQRSILQEK